MVVGLRQGLKELGYVEGRDVILEIRAGQGRYETALESARELASKGVRLFVSAGTVATQAVKESAGNLPIVFTQVGEPVAAGFVQSLARPGGNMTGFSHLLPETTGKRLEMLLGNYLDLKSRSPLERLAGHLLTLAGTDKGPARIALTYPRTVMAAAIGIAPENLSRAFARLASSGVHSEGNAIVVEDLAVLKAIRQGKKELFDV